MLLARRRRLLTRWWLELGKFAWSFIPERKYSLALLKAIGNFSDFPFFHFWLLKWFI
jgi:hypothetical protein